MKEQSCNRETLNVIENVLSMPSFIGMAINSSPECNKLVHVGRSKVNPCLVLSWGFGFKILGDLHPSLQRKVTLVPQGFSVNYKPNLHFFLYDPEHFL